MGEGWKLAMLQPGNDLTNQKKILRRVIGPQAVGEYDGFIQSEVAKLLEDLSEFTGDPYSLLSR
jgi:cytochrome P450